MCSIIGISCQDEEVTEMVIKEFISQSQIRGMHATGISYVDSGVIKTLSKPIPAKSFIKQDLPKSTMMIAHTRYSTSDIKYNQPISYKDIAIVHNGVITQEGYDEWDKYFEGELFKTKNDTELLLKCFVNNKNPFNKFPNASIACGVLYTDRMMCVRNNTRPLWIFNNEFFSGFASTSSIIIRAGKNMDIPIIPIATKPFTEYTFHLDGSIEERPVTPQVKSTLFTEDQQF